MSEEIEDRSLEEPLDLEKTEDELCRGGSSKIKYTRDLLLELNEVEVCGKLPGDFDLSILRSGKSNIKYTRALLLELNEVEVCGKLPADFDLSILRELNGESDSTTEHKTIPDNTYPYSSSTSSSGESWDSHLLSASKKSYSKGDFHSEITDGVRQRLLQESGYGAGILGPKIQKSALFQLRKSKDPYRPPHKKTPQYFSASSELGTESAGSCSVSATENGLTGSVDSVKGNGNLGHRVDLDDIRSSPVGKNEVSFKSYEESGVLTGNKEVQSGTTEDDDTTFDDFWDEILEIIHLEQDLKLTPIPFCDDTSDSEAENLNMDKSGDSTNSEHKINWPDEDSLITVEDLIAPHILYILKRDSMLIDRVISNTRFHIRNNLESVVIQEKLSSQLSYTQTSSYRGKENKNLLTKSIKPIIIHSAPTPNCDNSSYFHYQPFQETTLTMTSTNDSQDQYSLLQQPCISPSQQNQLLVGGKCPDPVKPSQQTICQGFGKTYADALNTAVREVFAVPKTSRKLYVDAVLSRKSPSNNGTLPGKRQV